MADLDLSSFGSDSDEPVYFTTFQAFQSLMQYRITQILLVSSLYDRFLFEEDGRLYELLREEYQGLNLTHAPELTQVSNAREAIQLTKKNNRFDLIITTLHIDDMHAFDFARKVRASGLEIPIVLLTYDHRELSELVLFRDSSMFDQIFVWQGNFRIIIAIIKYLEDKKNVEHDTGKIGVQSIILIEDQVRYYSSFLPIIYMELFKQSQRLISEGVNLSHKFLRMRARPKILMCSTYEEAWTYFSKYKNNILGVISDIDFKHHGKEDVQAGIEFARNVKQRMKDIPILLQSDSPENEDKARDIGAAFLLKDSATLLHDLRRFMNNRFGFGDFVFKTADGQKVGRAKDLKSLEQQLYIVPEESISFHSERNHFSNWLKARTEFWLAHKIRPDRVSDFPSIQVLRESLISSLNDYRKSQQRGIITDFKKDAFYPLSTFARIGGGSLGGKARGLSFINKLVYNYNINRRYKDIKVFVPPCVVLGTDVFDQFLDDNDLRSFALSASDDKEITRRFLKAKKVPHQIRQALSDFLELVQIPLAVRSSSLMEDSQYYPFAGVYRTYMLPNNAPELETRLDELISAIKRVYASTFYQRAKSYFKVTSYRLEEEKMAVVIQTMVGSTHDNRFYPDFSGAAKSYNFYPVEPQKPSEGIVSVAVGLGKMVFDGGMTVKFSPKYPQIIPQFYSVKQALKNNQRTFYALNLDGRNEEISGTEDTLIEKYDINVTEKDGTLLYSGSTYSHENDAIYDGISRNGTRMVTFAPVLKHKLFPLPELSEILLEIGSRATGTSVEIEFAVNLSGPPGEPKEFAILQMRPLALRHEFELLDIEEVETEKLICQSNKILGNGIYDNVYDIVTVDITRFDRLKTRAIADEISRLNKKMLAENRPYILIGVGRWGSLDPKLGIPVNWEQISGASVIVEAGFEDMVVEPSQGSHFFHNIVSFRVGYFTVGPQPEDNYIDWMWLLDQKSAEELAFTRHVHFDSPIRVKMNGHQKKGIIIKPSA